MIQVREYALITYDTSLTPGIDLGIVSKATFDWLLGLHARWKNNSPLLKLQNSTTVRLESYVGFLQSPNGETIEVLPKTHLTTPDQQGLNRTRVQLRNMLLAALSLKPREADAALLQRSNTPLHEWIIREFLSELVKLVRHGLHFDYLQVEEESRFIRGQLDISRQCRQTPDRATLFNIRHDVFSANRRENRLLKTALEYCLKLSVDPNNWRMANELEHKLHELTSYSNPEKELPFWENGKLMQSYSCIKPWCELIIEKLNPNFQKGIHKGIALLFPMEMLFESYVASCLRRDIGPAIRPQVASQYLLRHTPAHEVSSKPWFQLKPDILLTDHTSAHVLDTKWKLLQENANGTDKKYNMSQSDLYQLFAYGHKYMGGTGHMALIYPRHPEFLQPLPCFSYSDELHLWAIPFDLEAGKLVSGEWEKYMPALARDNKLAMTG